MQKEGTIGGRDDLERRTLWKGGMMQKGGQCRREG